MLVNLDYANLKPSGAALDGAAEGGCPGMAFARRRHRDRPLAMWTAYNRVRRVTKFHSVIGYPFKGLPV
jgi:hypothetical protein